METPNECSQPESEIDDSVPKWILNSKQKQQIKMEKNEGGIAPTFTPTAAKQFSLERAEFSSSRKNGESYDNYLPHTLRDQREKAK